LNKVLVTMLGFFGVPRSDSASGELCPFCPHSLRPCSWPVDLSVWSPPYSESKLRQ